MDDELRLLEITLLLLLVIMAEEEDVGEEQLIFLVLVRWLEKRWRSASSSCLTSAGASRSISPPASSASTGVSIVRVLVAAMVVGLWGPPPASPRRFLHGCCCGCDTLLLLWTEAWVPRLLSPLY